MKRISALMLAALAVMSLAACGRSRDDGAVSGGTDTVRESSDTLPETVPETETVRVTETEPVTEPPVIHVESLTLSAYEATLAVGESFMPIVAMAPADAADLTEIWYSSNTVVAEVDMYGNITARSAGTCTVTVLSADNNAACADFAVTVTPPPETDPPVKAAPKAASGVTYIDGILIANKSYPLPEDYNPGEDPEALAALYRMFDAAAADGCSMHIDSGFRSYATQTWLYNSYVQRDGVSEADRYSARPGYSEHQSGLAFDINDTSSAFASTPEAYWLAKNAYKYGFILRYPEGKESITGYMFEPWHYRYVGVEKAKLIYDSGLTLEEYLGITSFYS